MFLGLFRGLYCPFCRRTMASLGRVGTSLASLGVQMIGVVATPTNNARLFFKYRRAPICVAADPAMTTHAAYGLPTLPENSLEEFLATRINPTGELSEPLPILEATKALGRLDLFTPTPADRDDVRRTWNQLGGLFLIDRAGIVRWIFHEAAAGPGGIGMFPPEAELVTVAQAIIR